MRLSLSHLLIPALALAVVACGDGDKAEEMATPSVLEAQPQEVEISTEAGRVRMVAEYPDALEQELEIVREGPDQMRVGRSYDYSLTVRNDGDETIQSLVVIEQLPATVRILQMVDAGGGQASLEALAQGQAQGQGQVPAETDRQTESRLAKSIRERQQRQQPERAQPAPQPEQAQQQGSSNHRIRWNVGDLEPEAERTLAIQMVPQESGTLIATTWFEFEDALQMAFEVVDPELTIDLVVVDAEAEAQKRFFICEQPRVLLRVANRGTGTTVPVAVDLALPPALGLAPASDGVEAEGEDAVAGLLEFEPIPAGESRTREIPLQILAGGQVRIEAQVRGSADPISITPIELELIDPQVEFQVEAPEMVKVGDQARFNAVVRNTGEGPVEDLVLRAALGGLQALPAEDAEQSWQEGSLPIGNLAAGESRNITVIAATPSEQGVIDTLWELDGRCLDVEPIARQVSVEGVQALLVELVDTEDPVMVDGTTSYRLRLTNQGSARIDQLSVSLNLPEQLQVERFEGLTGDEQVQGLTDGEWLLGQQLQLEAGESHEWVVAARAVAPGQTQVQASVHSSATREPVIEQESTTIQ